MDEFRIAGSLPKGADTEVFGQVVRITAYTGILHRLVEESFAFCPVHLTPVPRPPRREPEGPTAPASPTCGIGCPSLPNGSRA